MDKENPTPAGSLHLITCVVQRGKGDAVGKAAIEAGAGGATTFFARGTGTRERLGLLGLAIVPEKEVILVLCQEEESSRIFEAIVKAGKLDLPGMGIAYITPVLKVVGGNFKF
ncbi:MAG: P-II family nitrogen regulator [Myxococcales bacterium]|nr:MAG: P-II family nitrogen regulator [Myxococcales bacterium]